MYSLAWGISPDKIIHWDTLNLAMLSEKSLVKTCLILAVFYHFVFFFGYYGPFHTIFRWSCLLAWGSVFLLIFLYFAANWQSNVKGGFVKVLYKIFLLIVALALIRSILHVHGVKGFFWLIFDSYNGLSLFPALFFIIGCNSKYFALTNNLLSVFCFLTFLITLFFIKSFELAVFILMPIFYVIVTYPLQSPGKRILTFIIAATIISVSLTHRAGMMRIIISYFIVVIYYLILKIKINKTLLYIIIFSVLMIPFYFLYRGMTGYNVFTEVLGEQTEDYSEQNLRIDTRTFLYSEVFQDLKFSEALVVGKGIDGGYSSVSFQTSNRKGVEVGFLQILLKTGIIGFLLYFILIFSAIFKALGKSNNIYLKCLGILLSSYVLMFFIENVLAFDLLNIVIWLVIGMCHSKELLRLNDHEIKNLFINGKMDKGII